MRSSIRSASRRVSKRSWRSRLPVWYMLHILACGLVEIHERRTEEERTEPDRPVGGERDRSHVRGGEQRRPEERRDEEQRRVVEQRRERDPQRGRETPRERAPEPAAVEPHRLADELADGSLG